MVFVGKNKLMSGSKDLLWFWCHSNIVKETLAYEKVNVLQPDQFEEVKWPVVNKALHNVPRMFQCWACKQVTDVAETNQMQAIYMPNHDKNCPSCGVCIETCGHVLSCEESSKVDLLHKSINSVDQWMKDQGTDLVLWKFLIEYAHSQGGKTMSEIVGWRRRSL